MRRTCLATVLLGSALVLTEACGAGAAAAPRPSHQAFTARRGKLRRTVLLTGEIRPVSALVVSVPQTPQWRVQIKWLVPDGAKVKAGDILVEFDNTAFASSLEEKRLAVLQAAQALERQQAKNRESLLKAEIEVERRRVALEKAKLDAGVPKSVLSRREYEERHLALEKARSAHEKASANLAAARTAAKADLSVAKVNLTKARRDVKIAETAIKDLVVRSPRDGIAVIAEHPWEERKLQVGDNIWVGRPVLSLPDLSRVEVEAALSDVDDGRVSVGMPALCTLDAYPRRHFSGRVTGVSRVAREAAESSLRRSFTVTVSLDHSDPERMVPGMSVKVEVDAGSLDNVILAPRAALDLAAAKPRIHLADGEWRTVALGPCNPLMCAVKQGLAEGERLAPAAGSGT